MATLLPDEPEIILARQAFPDAQAEMATAAIRSVGRFDLSWFGSLVLADRGSFAVVNDVPELSEYVGEFLRFTLGTRSVNAYCVGRDDLHTPFAVSRRLFLGLALLTLDEVAVDVEVLARPEGV